MAHGAVIWETGRWGAMLIRCRRCLWDSGWAGGADKKAGNAEEARRRFEGHLPNCAARRAELDADPIGEADAVAARIARES